MSAKNCTNNRRARGSAFGLIACCALLIVIGIVAAFRFSVYLASSQEMKNSIDAGALNVAKRVFEIRIPPVDPEIKVGGDYGYSDVVDTGKMIGLATVNRMWGKAFLINANAQTMVEQGYGCDPNIPNIAWEHAQKINNALYNVVTDKGAVYVYFNKLITGKPAKLLGDKGTVSASNMDQWATSCMYPGEESNIVIQDPGTIPGNISPKTATHSGQVYMQGYNPSTANGKGFVFVTFHAGEAPHLVANATFDQSKNIAIAGGKVMPLPNAFREAGKIDGQVSLAAGASAVANPMRSYALAIPHSYVTITISSTAICRVDDGAGHVKFADPIPYFYNTGSIQVFRNLDLGAKKYQYPESDTKWRDVTGLINGYASLGNELQPNNLYQAITALPGDHEQALGLVLQRVKQFKPGASASDLKRVLQGQQLQGSEGGAVQTYYVYPKYSSQDFTDPQLACGTSSNLPRWLKPAGADGEKSKEILKETTKKDDPNKCWSTLIDGRYEVPNKPRDQWPQYAQDAHRTALSGTITWQPGTGWSQCLGELSINRTTEVLFTGWPTQAEGFMDKIFGPVK